MTVREEKFIDAVVTIEKELDAKAKWLADDPVSLVIKEVFLGASSKLKKAVKEFCDRSGDYNFDDDSELKNRQELMEDKGVMSHVPKS